MKNSSRQRIKAAVARLTNKFPGVDWYADKDSTGYRLEIHNQSRQLSPRLPAGLFALWLEAFEVGLEMCDAIEKAAEDRNLEGMRKAHGVTSPTAKFTPGPDPEFDPVDA